MEFPADLLTGIELVDQQHKAFFKGISLFENCIDNNPTADEVEAALSYIELYANTHFQTEEHYMKSTSYDYIEDHVHEHKLFQEYFFDLKLTIGDHEKQALREVVSFMKEWLIVHIKKYDKSFVDFLKSNDIVIA